MVIAGTHGRYFDILKLRGKGLSRISPFLIIFSIEIHQWDRNFIKGDLFGKHLTVTLSIYLCQ